MPTLVRTLRLLIFQVSAVWPSDSKKFVTSCSTQHFRIFQVMGGEDSRTSVSPKSFRYLNFGITSFNFIFIGINKKYLLIIKKFITRFNYNFWLLIHWLFITLNALAYTSFKVTKNFKNKLTSFYVFVYPYARFLICWNQLISLSCTY